MGKLGLIPHHHCDVTSRGEVVIRLIQMQYINDINGLIILKKKHSLYHYYTLNSYPILL